MGQPRGCASQEDPLARSSRLTSRWSGVFNAISLTLLVACASPGVPPGGPERHVPPIITRTQPDTNAVNVRGKQFVIHFDEVISERAGSAASLNDLVLISPRNSAAEVDWHRTSLSIHPHKGWLPNTAYTVTLLPGISDLRGNVRTTETVVSFSTGPTIPPTSISGELFDWLSGLPINTGMVEARASTDTSLVYLTASDSVGHYRIRGLPPGQYQVRGYSDANRNRALDPGEAFDTTRVYLKDSLDLELLAFAHDSTGPRLGTVAVEDSVTLRAIFDTPLDPRVKLDPTHFTLTGTDSSRIAIVSVTPARPDTTRATPNVQPVSQSVIPIPQRRTAAAKMALPKPTRPLLVRDVIIVIATPLHRGSSYKLTALNAVGPTGRALSSDKTFAVPNLPKPVPRDTSRKPVAVPPAPARPGRPQQ